MLMGSKQTRVKREAGSAEPSVSSRMRSLTLMYFNIVITRYEIIRARAEEKKRRRV